MFESIIKKRFEKALKFDEGKAIDDILSVKILEDQIIDLNQDQLYNEGLLADNMPTGTYAKNTIEGTSKYPGKIEKGQPYDHVTLKDTGAFYNSMEVVATPNGIVIEADDPHGLDERYPKMLGLTEQSKAEILPEIKDRLIEKVKESITA